MNRRRREIITTISAVVAAAALVVAGIFIFGGHHARSHRPPAASPLTSPFTGERVTALGPVLAVKIDNIAQARPQTGLTSVDIVYVLPVEGGLSRFLAVFSSHLPPVIGPVRSAREDDLELVRQFGRPAFAYSGATPHLLPFIHRARVVDLYAGLTSGYYRSPSRVAPHNLYAHPAQLIAEAHGASTAHDIGFRFGPVPAGGQAAASRSVTYPAASFTFTRTSHRPAGGWSGWTAPRPAAPRTGNSARPRSSSSTRPCAPRASSNTASGRRTPTAPAPALGSSCVTAWPSPSAGPARTPIAARGSRRHRASR
jgi:hypothetical protein